MNIDVAVVGMLEENCYILKKNNHTILIDPGAEAEKIKGKIGDTPLLAVLLTHRHFDHIGALNEFNVSVYEKINLEEKSYQIGPFTFKVIFTPGHTSDSVSYYFEQEKACFTGDFLFAGTVGRTDLPTGDMSQMKNSIEVIKKYSDDIVIYPGHGEATSLGIEKKENPYF